jgi:predicted small lipoprotein YifL
MKIIVARLLNFAGFLGIIASITLSGCGVRGPLYLPRVPPAPQAPTQPEPKGQQWPAPNTSANGPQTTPAASTTK